MKQLLIITTLVAVLFFMALLPSQGLLFDPNFHQQLSDFLPKTWLGYLFFIVTLVLLTSVGLPRQITAFSCGYTFGAVSGSLIALLSVTLACAITYSVARFLLNNIIKNKVSNTYLKCQSLFANQLLHKIIIIRLLPIGSNFLTNIIAGTCKLNVKRFILGSCIGFIPQIIIFSLMGAGTKIADKTQIIISIGLFIVALILGFYLYVRNKQLIMTNAH